MSHSSQGEFQKLTGDDFAIIAHRGASGYAPENTLPALKMALELGANYLEVDVHQSHDQQIMVIHDARVNRTTNGLGQVVDMTLKELKQLDAGSWFDPKFAGTSIPTLEEVLEILTPKTKLIIEIKGRPQQYPHIEKDIVALVRKKQRQEQVIYKSFNHITLQRFQALSPQTARLYVFLLNISPLKFTIDVSLRFGNIYNNPSNAQLFQAHRWFLSRKQVKKSHAHAIKMIAWHVNTLEEIRAMLLLGVNGIETNYPDRVLSCLS